MAKKEKSALFLFTLRFPYGGGEQFLAEEILHLCERFDNIFIQPMFLEGEKRSLPDNVHVYRPVWTSKREKLYLYIRNIVNPLNLAGCIRECGRAFFKHRKLHPSVYMKILLWSVYRGELGNTPGVKAAIEWDAGPRVAYAYWAHVPSMCRVAFNQHSVPIAVRFHRVDLYIDAGASDSGWSRHATYQPWHDDLYDECDALLFISEHGRDYYMNHWGKSREVSEKMHISRLGTKDYGVGLRKQSNDRILVVSCSRIAPVKQVAKIAELLKKISKLKPVEWHHFGGGLTDDKAVEEGLKNVDKNRLNFNFWGYTKNEKIVSFYKSRSVDLFVNLSASEGVPVSIIEAISFNIPVLATNVGGTADVVIDKKSGMLLETSELDRLDEVAVRVSNALEPSGMLCTIEPRLVWQERYNAEKNYCELVQLLKKLEK